MYGFKEKVMALWERVVGRDAGYDENYGTEDELALDNRTQYDDYDAGVVSSSKVMKFPEKNGHSLKLYKLRGQQWWEAATRVCDDFNEGSSVMVNTEEANKDAIVRMVDFLTGVAYSQKGRLVKSGTTGFVVVPANCTIGGDIGEDAFEDVSSPYSSNVF